MNFRGLAWVPIFVLAAACTAIVDADERKLGPSPMPCSPKDPPLSCVCVDGTKSIQVCNALSRYDPCRCPMTAAGSSAAR